MSAEQIIRCIAAAFATEIDKNYKNIPIFVACFVL
jgi:hypothetical protein